MAKAFKPHSQAFSPPLNPDSRDIRFWLDDTIVRRQIESVGMYPVEYQVVIYNE